MTEVLRSRLAVSTDRLAEFCRRNQIQELLAFGSALREDFTPESDFDFLVSFQPGARIGFLAFSRIRRELAELLGRKVDLVSKRGLKAIIQDEVLSSAESVYAA